MQGLSNFNTTNNSPYSAGPPFPALAADNGLSVDPVTGRIVLGEDGFSGANLATLQNSREIPLNGNNIYLTDVAPSFLMQLNSFGIVALELTTQSRAEMNASTSGSFFGLESDSVLYGPPKFSLTDLSTIPRNIAILRQNGTEFGIVAGGGAGISMLTLDQPLGLYRIGDIDPALNGTLLSIDDVLQRISVDSAGSPYLFMNVPGGTFQFGDILNGDHLLIDSINHNAHIFLNGNNTLLLDNVSQVYFMGDIDGSGNSSTVSVDDANARIFLTAGNGVHTSPPSGVGTDGAWLLGKPKAAVVAFEVLLGER